MNKTETMITGVQRAGESAIRQAAPNARPILRAVLSAFLQALEHFLLNQQQQPPSGGNGGAGGDTDTLTPGA